MRSPAGPFFLPRQRGLSLVELMVGMAIGLVLVAGLALLFANTSRSSSELEKSLRQIENGRFAIDLLAEDLSVAGYFGEARAAGTGEMAAESPCDLSAALVPKLAALAVPPGKLPFAVRGYTPPEAAGLACLENHLAGTPALVIRRLDTAAVAPADAAGGLLHVQSSNHPSESSTTYLADTATATFVLKALDGSVNVVRRYVSRIYYLASCSDCGSDTIPTLKRAELRGDRMVVSPLAEGIERIAFDYGFDTDADGAPDRWLGLNGAAANLEADAASALGWGNVVAVRIHLVARTTEASPGYTDTRVYSLGTQGTATFVTFDPADDAFKRRAYVTTARLNSVAGLRE